MTLSPRQIGDKGQRYQAEYREATNGAMTPPEWKVLGWSDTEQGARDLCEAWALRPSTVDTRFIDRHKEHGTVAEIHR